jgi:lipopolysaccharide export system protein LptA
MFGTRERMALAAALFISITLVKPAIAASNVDVEANEMEIIDAQHQTIFRGNVVAKRPTDQIHSDEMVVTNVDAKQSDGTMKSVTDFIDAKGNVTITTKTQTITGQWAKFYVQRDKLEVGGNVRVVQGESSVKGEKLELDLKTNHLQMSGGRVKGSFVPK